MMLCARGKNTCHLKPVTRSQGQSGLRLDLIRRAFAESFFKNLSPASHTKCIVVVWRSTLERRLLKHFEVLETSGCRTNCIMGVQKPKITFAAFSLHCAWLYELKPCNKRGISSLTTSSPLAKPRLLFVCAGLKIHRRADLLVPACQIIFWSVSFSSH